MHTKQVAGSFAASSLAASEIVTLKKFAAVSIILTKIACCEGLRRVPLPKRRRCHVKRK